MHNFEVMICTLDWRLSSLVKGAWGANTFPMRKQLPNPHFQNTQTFIFFLVFLAFSSNKRWWRLHTFSFLGRHTCEPRVALLPKGKLRKLETPLGTIFRELGHSISVQHLIMTSLFMFFLPFYLWFLSIFVHNLFYVIFGVFVYQLHS